MAPSVPGGAWALVLAASAALLACPGSSDSVSDAGSARFVVDGVLDEWSAGEHVRASGDDLFLRLPLPEEETLQAAAHPVVLLLDLDGDASTGGGFDWVPAAVAGGAELAVVFSPPTERLGLGGRGDEGVAVLRAASGGVVSKTLPHEALDLVFSPTHAAKEFELRVSRRAPEVAAALEAGAVSARLAGVSQEGAVLWSTSLGEVDLPPLDAGPERAEVAWPARPAGALRVVSWNVLFASPARSPEPFARVLRALDPDLVLVQEWEKADAADFVAWFEEHVSPGWHALDSPGWGVAVIARGPVRRLGPARVERPADAPADDFRPDHALRLAAAVVETRLGAVAAASIHLKCCGPAGGPQDRARIAEAETIRATLEQALAALEDAAPAIRVVGGDLNLVGSDVPLEALRRGLAPGGGDLDVARAPVLGDLATYTWRGSGSRYSPGRLDFVLFGGAEEVQAFVLDAARLPEAALRRAGLEREDSARSDHLALVADLRPLAVPSGSRPR